MTDSQYRRALRMLGKGIHPQEVAASVGLSDERIGDLVRLKIPEKSISPREMLREDLLNRTASVIREFFEMGYTPQEFADFLGPLIDAIGQDVNEAERERQVRETMNQPICVDPPKKEPLSPPIKKHGHKINSDAFQANMKKQRQIIGDLFKR